MPSVMNGSRMNQLLAPTSRMTSISRRRANTAVRIVLKMSNTDTKISATPKMRTHELSVVSDFCT